MLKMDFVGSEYSITFVILLGLLFNTPIKN